MIMNTVSVIVIVLEERLIIGASCSVRWIPLDVVLLTNQITWHFAQLTFLCRLSEEINHK